MIEHLLGTLCRAGNVMRTAETRLPNRDGETLTPEVDRGLGPGKVPGSGDSWGELRRHRARGASLRAAGREGAAPSLKVKGHWCLLSARDSVFLGRAQGLQSRARLLNGASPPCPCGPALCRQPP